MTIDTNKLFTDLVAATSSVSTLTASNGTLTAELTAANTKVTEGAAALTASEAKVVQLTADLAAATSVPNNEADYQVALSFLGEVATKILVASGAEAPAEMPKTIAELKALIEDKTAQLTAILPVGGVALGAAAAEDAKPALVASAFTNRKIGK